MAPQPVTFVSFNPRKDSGCSDSSRNDKSDEDDSATPSSTASSGNTAQLEFFAFRPGESKDEKRKRQTIVRKKAMSHFLKESNQDGEKKRSVTKANPSIRKPLLLAPKPSKEVTASKPTFTTTPSVPSKRKRSVPTKINTADPKGPLPVLSPRTLLSVSRTDPFESLPIDGSPAIDRAVYFCQSLGMGLTPFTGFNSWGKVMGKQFAYPETVDEHDPLFLVTRFMCSAAIRDFILRSTGRQRNPCEDYLLFKSLTIKNIRERIAQNSIDPSVCIAVVMQAVVAAYGMRRDEATTHLKAVQEMIISTGGLSAYTITVRRIVLLEDLLINTLFDTPYLWPSGLNTAMDSQEIPNDLYREARSYSRRTLYRLPDDIEIAPNDLLHLHTIGLLRSEHWKTYIDHPGVSNSFFQIFHFVRDPIPRIVGDGYFNNEIMPATFDLAVKIFIRLTCRIFWFPGSPSLSMFTDMMDGLNLEDPQCLEYWVDMDHLDYLTWILALLTNAAPLWLPGRSRIENWLGYVIEMLGMQPEEFNETIRSFLWTDIYPFIGRQSGWLDLYNMAVATRRKDDDIMELDPT